MNANTDTTNATNATNASIEIGTIVTGGYDDEDRDTGTVEEIDGERAFVAWDGAQVKTWTHIADLTVVE